MNCRRTARKWFVIVGVGLIIIAACMDLFATPPTPASPSAASASPSPEPVAAGTASIEPKIRWSPASVTQTILAGDSATIPVSFSASQDLSNTVLRVVPELQPFVQVTPQAFASLTKGQVVNLTLMIAAPANSLPGTFQGAIQLRSGSAPPTNLAQPLPVTIQIAWRPFRDDALQAELELPPDLTLLGKSDVAAVFEKTGPHGYMFELSRRPNPESRSLDELAQELQTRDVFLTTTSVVVADRTSLKILSEKQGGATLIFLVPDNLGQTVYSLTFYPTNPDQLFNFFGDNQTVINHIVDTFKSFD